MQSRHSRTHHFLQQGLFDNLSSFSELEARISRLDTNQGRGDAFEVFAQGYLATQKIVQAKEVWPFDKIPEKVKHSIAISTPKDMGVDGVFETAIGEHAAYQVKFRTGRPSLTWDELSTFMGLTEQASERVLFTNCDDIPALMNDRDRFFCIRGNDLDRLEARDFEIIRDWLRKGFFTPVRKTPLPHQEEALQAVQSALSEADRATLVMACGTGKTLVALWAAERLGAKSILVLVPSLALVRQTLHEWLKEASWPNFSFLCVCSDPTVTKGSDDVVVRQSDLDFPVTTESSIVQEYLSSSYDGVRVVFSTYQSARVLAEGMPNQEPFDLGLFDEAHKTAGRQGTRFSFALTDENMPISKRLFMTATPRHYDVRKKDKEGDAKLVYSMDVPETYGRIAHTLSFREAATRDIICDYKVVISVVTSDEVNDDLLRRGQVIVQGDAVKARQVANQIALRRAVERYGVERIFTFHSSVASASSFTGSGGEGVNSELPAFLAVHVNGKLPVAKREHILQEFAQADKAVISNARCLTEGVDLPAVDMVAFMSPKKSKVDIVQATGRAMRKAENKTVGYVMIPLYVEQEAGENIEEALERTGFDEVWNVLEAMKEQDDVLADIMRRMREDKGRTGGYDEQRFHEHVETLGPQVSLFSLRNAITALCVERLGIAWDERYGQLVAYKIQHGDCIVPAEWPENPPLARWVGTQRRTKDKGKLSKERIQRLEGLGFAWDPAQANWEEMFEALQNYRKQHTDCDVPQYWPENPKLGNWVTNQRINKRKGRLSNERIQRLETLGLVWDPYDAKWEEMYLALREYRGQYGDCNVYRYFTEIPKLGAWVHNQRNLRRTGEGELSNERIQRLEALGFIWDPLADAWEEMYAELREYKNRHGDCNVPARSKEYPKLGRWVNTQRGAKREDKLSSEYIQRLETLGFVWDPYDAQWEEMYLALRGYRGQHGDCNVPQGWSENTELGRWVSAQRRRRSENRISNERIKRLEALGFVWDQLAFAWEEMYVELREYKSRNGDCNVPAGSKEYPKLGRWVNKQRNAKREDKLSSEYIQRLETLGFVWDPLADAWEEMYAELREYKNRHGDCNVPNRWTENPKLAAWSQKQRTEKRKNRLSNERIQRLEALGFIWDPLADAWEEMYAELREYKNRYGDCNVPHGWPENPKLRNWAKTQRQTNNKGGLSKERIERLEALGFPWDLYEVNWETMFSALEEYRRQHGNCNVPQRRTETRQLAIWVRRQRNGKRKGTLSQERIQRLEALGFKWTVK